MHVVQFLTGNIYFWVFLSALMMAAAINSVITGRSFLPPFYFYFSFSIAVMTVSVFFVDWKNLHWSSACLVFFLFILLLFVLIFRMSFFFKLITFFFLLSIIFFSNNLVTGWQKIDTHRRILTIRLLSERENQYTYDISNSQTQKGDLFYTSANTPGKLVIYQLHIPDWFFFIPAKDLVLIEMAGKESAESMIMQTNRNRIIKWAASVIPSVTIKNIVLKLHEMHLLWQYNLIYKNGYFDLFYPGEE